MSATDFLLRNCKRPWFWRVVALVMMVTIGLSVAYAVADKLMFPAPKTQLVPQLPYFKLTVADNTQIAVIYLKNPKAEYTLIFAHGNGEQLGKIEHLLKEMRGLDLSVIAYDYEGYGLSDGKPTEAHCYRDADAIYRYATSQCGIEPQKLIYWGYSIGSGSASYLAEQYPGAGLILTAPFTSAFAVVHLDFLPGDRFPNFKRIAKINKPLLVMHGTADMLIDQEQGRTLYDLAAEPKRFFAAEQAGHNDIWGSEGFWSAVKDFLALVKETADAKAEFGD